MNTWELSAKTAGYSATPHLLGSKPLWGKPGFKLPNYIENVAKGLIEDGHDRSSAIAIAISSVKRWAAGGGKVGPEVRAASAKAVAQWTALKAAAGGGSSHAVVRTRAVELAGEPGWEGSQGPFRGDYGKPHAYARDIHSGAGNCVCGSGPTDKVHTQLAPGVPNPGRPVENASRRHAVELNVVASAAGVARYKAPIGTPIVGGKPQVPASRSTTAKPATSAGSSGASAPSPSTPAQLSATVRGLDSGTLASLSQQLMALGRTNPAVAQAQDAVRTEISVRAGTQVNITSQPATGARTISPDQQRAAYQVAQNKLTAQRKAVADAKRAAAKKKAAAKHAAVLKRRAIAAAKAAAKHRAVLAKRAAAHKRALAAAKHKVPAKKKATGHSSAGAGWAANQGWVQGLDTNLANDRTRS
jgi:hypothetical protein